MTIRLMTIDDYDQVYDLWLHTPGMGLNALDDSREGIARYLARNPNTCFVAEEDENIAGVILSGHDGRRGFIYHMAVGETKRMHGMGGRLLEQAIEALRQEGVHKAALVVYQKNQIGNAFWERRGFLVREDLHYRDKFLHEMD